MGDCQLAAVQWRPLFWKRIPLGVDRDGDRDGDRTVASGVVTVSNGDDASTGSSNRAGNELPAQAPLLLEAFRGVRVHQARAPKSCTSVKAVIIDE